MAETQIQHTTPAGDADARRAEAARVASVFLIAGGGNTIAVGLIVSHWPLPGWRPWGLAATGLGAILAGLAVLRLGQRLSWRSMNITMALSTLYVGAAVVYTVGTRGFGPIFLHWTVLWSFTFLPKRWAVWQGLLALAVLALVFTQPGWPVPFVYWIFLAVTIAVTGWTVSSLVERLETARREVADLNDTLEARVVEQVREIEGLSRLRRFLSPQVAEAVLSSGSEVTLQPHRRQIAVIFCDLRGFTSFASGAEPEEVVDALDQYYRVVGEVLRRHDATVGAFAGDGIMAYLNDPVPCEDPAGSAVQIAMELRAPMAAFVEAWTRRGFHLGYGVGIAYGYATLGTIGFEGRSDYTALGSVVNLAARLCGEAAAGEVLIDSRTSDAVDQRYSVASRDVLLKGFPTAVTAYAVGE